MCIIAWLAGLVDLAVEILRHLNFAVPSATSAA